MVFSRCLKRSCPSCGPFTLTALLLGLSAITSLAQSAPGDTELITVRLPGQATGSGPSESSRISASGRYVVFVSHAADLVAGDTNVASDVFWRDQQTGIIERISVSSGSGAQANALSLDPSVSSDGRYVAFVSYASNLVANDSNATADIFVRDRALATTTRLNANLGTPQPDGDGLDPVISADGRYVAYTQFLDKAVFVFDRQSGTNQRISVNSIGVAANSLSFYPSISADGRYVAFVSFATNLVPNDTNEGIDVFVRDRLTGVTERMTVDSNEAQVRSAFTGTPSVSADGRYVAFTSPAATLVPSDTNGWMDVFVRDRQAGVTERVSVNSNEIQGDSESREPSISADGRYVAFRSNSSNLGLGGPGRPNIFVRDRLMGVTRRVSADADYAPNGGGSASPSINADGRYVAFISLASQLAAGDNNGVSDVFVYDWQAAVTLLVSEAKIASDTAGGQSPVLSADGRYVAFESLASSLVAGDTNRTDDIFVRDRQSGTLERVSVSSSGMQSNGMSHLPSISADGRFVAFESRASNLSPEDNNFGRSTVFVRDRQSAITEVIVTGRGADQGSNPSISANGRYVAFLDERFMGSGINLVFVRDRQDGTGVSELASVNSNGAEANNSSFAPSTSADGRYVVFASAASNLVPNDTNGEIDVFVRDRQLGTTSRVSVTSSGAQVFAESFIASISADGRYVAFGSFASNLVANDSNGVFDAFVRDRQLGTTVRVSVNSAGVQANAATYPSRISPDGRYVVLISDASNLVANDTNQLQDAFLRDRQLGTTERVSLNSSGAQGNGEVNVASISADARFIGFSTFATNMGVVDLNGIPDVFVRERAVSNLTVSPKALTFGNQAINTTSTARAVTVTNISAAAVAITGVTLAGTNPGQFARTHNCGTSLAAGASCTVNVVFKPTSIGAKSAVLNVNGGGGGLRSVTLTGTGVQ
jgi:Tol biopolymer transport system component